MARLFAFLQENIAFLLIAYSIQQENIAFLLRAYSIKQEQVHKKDGQTVCIPAREYCLPAKSIFY